MLSLRDDTYLDISWFTFAPIRVRHILRTRRQADDQVGQRRQLDQIARPTCWRVDRHVVLKERCILKQIERTRHMPHIMPERGHGFSEVIGATIVSSDMPEHLVAGLIARRKEPVMNSR